MAVPSHIRRFRGRLVACILTGAVLALVSQAALAEVTQHQLAEIVKKAIQDESVMFDPPRVSVNDQMLNYSAGKIFYPDYTNKPTKPLGFPVDIQFKTELIRKYRADHKAELDFLEPYLARMEKVVSDELALIAKHNDGQEELVKQLEQLDNQAREILKEGIGDWAKNQGLTVAEESSPVAMIPTVIFKTVPAGGTVYYLNAVDYNVYKAAGVLDEVDRWNQVPAEQMDMGGSFYFRAAWPGGKTKQTAKILIDENRTISLQAD